MFINSSMCVHAQTLQSCLTLCDPMDPKNWCFWTMVLEKTLESPWTARRSNKSILKEISPGCSLEGLMLKLKPQHFGHLMRRVDSLEKTLMLGGIGGRRRRGRQRMAGWHHRLDGHEFEWTPGNGDGQGGLVCCDSWVTKSRTRLRDWTEMMDRQASLSVGFSWQEYQSGLPCPFPALLHMYAHLSLKPHRLAQRKSPSTVSVWVDWRERQLELKQLLLSRSVVFDCPWPRGR